MYRTSPSGPDQRRQAQFLVLDYHPHTLADVRARLPAVLSLRKFLGFAIDLLEVKEGLPVSPCVCAMH